MKKTFSILVAIILFAAASQAQILSSFTATQQAQIKAALKITADSVRAEYKAANTIIGNQVATISVAVTDSNNVKTIWSRIKGIEKFNATTALTPDTLNSFTISKGILYTKPVDLTAVKNAIADITTAMETLSKTVGDNKALFDALKARIDNLKLIFQIQ